MTAAESDLPEGRGLFMNPGSIMLRAAKAAAELTPGRPVTALRMIRAR